jgi:hypothetical protein
VSEDNKIFIEERNKDEIFNKMKMEKIKEE